MVLCKRASEKGPYSHCYENAFQNYQNAKWVEIFGFVLFDQIDYIVIKNKFRKRSVDTIRTFRGQNIFVKRPKSQF